MDNIRCADDCFELAVDEEMSLWCAVPEMPEIKSISSATIMNFRREPTPVISVEWKVSDEPLQLCQYLLALIKCTVI